MSNRPLTRSQVTRIKREYMREKTRWLDGEGRKRPTIQDVEDSLKTIDNRNPALVQARSRARIEAAENADRMYKQREHRISVAMEFLSPEIHAALKYAAIPENRPGWEILLRARKHVAHDKSAVTMINVLFDRATGARK